MILKAMPCRDLIILMMIKLGISPLLQLIPPEIPLLWEIIIDFTYLILIKGLSNGKRFILFIFANFWLAGD